jgi:uncharacterized protein (DUF2236 family)
VGEVSDTLQRTAAGDPGLFGPGSMSWRVHGEPILWLSAPRALFLQMLLPRALAGVLQNSHFREDPFGRLFRTAEFFGTVIYGPTDAARHAGARVSRLHARMRANDPDTGEEYRIDDQHLLRWIHITAVESFCSTAQRAGLGLTEDEVGQYYAEQLRTAELVGLDPATVPTTTAGIEAYYRQMRPELAVGEDAKWTARYLLLQTFPLPRAYTPLRPLWTGAVAYGVSLMPRWARRMYGLPGLPTTDLTATLAARGLRLAGKALPRSLYEGPAHQAAMARLSTVEPELRPVSMTRNTGDSTAMPRQSADGTRKAQRRPI